MTELESRTEIIKELGNLNEIISLDIPALRKIFKIPKSYRMTNIDQNILIPIKSLMKKEKIYFDYIKIKNNIPYKPVENIVFFFDRSKHRFFSSLETLPDQYIKELKEQAITPISGTDFKGTIIYLGYRFPSIPKEFFRICPYCGNKLIFRSCYSTIQKKNFSFIGCLSWNQYKKFSKKCKYKLIITDQSCLDDISIFQEQGQNIEHGVEIVQMKFKEMMQQDKIHVDPNKKYFNFLNEFEVIPIFKYKFAGKS